MSDVERFRVLEAVTRVSWRVARGHRACRSIAMDATLRKATSDDVEPIVRLIAAHPGQLLPRRHDDVGQLIDTFWVVEEEGELAGCCCLEIYSPKIAEVRSLAVREGSRGRGYGARLVEAAVAEARRRGIPQILVVTSNVEFFGRLNFQTCMNEKYALFYEDRLDATPAPEE